MAGVKVPKTTKALIAEVTSNDLTKEPFAHEKLSPTLALYKADDFEAAVDNAYGLVKQLGIGHTSVLFTNQITHQDRVKYIGNKMKTGRVLVNVPAAQGAIGGVFNFKLAPLLTCRLFNNSGYGYYRP
jgi:acetaldehyde dehydrogenase / alcohol dehydrogenase